MSANLTEDIRKSFLMSHSYMLRLWDSERNELNPYYMTAQDNEHEVFWICEEKKKHVWQETVASMIEHNSRCPYCTGEKKEDIIN